MLDRKGQPIREIGNAGKENNTGVSVVRLTTTDGARNAARHP